MKAKSLHGWSLSTSQAIEIQNRLTAHVSRKNELGEVRYIAGVDISVDMVRKAATGSAVLLDYPGLEIVEIGMAQGTLDFPYIPGLLSFREIPLTLAACEKLTIAPDLIIVDGQGIAHPRRIGLASHLGLFLDTPTIGCAKSLLCGKHEDVEAEPGSYSPIMDRGETIGAALRTKTAVKPVYISIGHKTDLENAIHWIMRCSRGYRLPEPTRLAHLAAGGKLRSQKSAAAPVIGKNR